MPTQLLNRISFADLTGRNRIYAIYCMLLHTSRRDLGGRWKKSLDIERDVKDGYNPDQDFAFCLDQHGQLTTQVLLSTGELPERVGTVRQ